MGDKSWRVVHWRDDKLTADESFTELEAAEEDLTGVATQQALSPLYQNVWQRERSCGRSSWGRRGIFIEQHSTTRNELHSNKHDDEQLDFSKLKKKKKSKKKVDFDADVTEEAPAKEQGNSSTLCYISHPYLTYAMIDNEAEEDADPDAMFADLKKKKKKKSKSLPVKTITYYL